MPRLRFLRLTAPLATLVFLVAPFGLSAAAEPPVPRWEFAGHAIRIETEHASVLAAPPGPDGPMLDLVFQPGQAYPAAHFRLGMPRDLSAFTGVEAQLTNLDNVERKVVLRVDNDGDWRQEPWNTEVDSLAPGETKTIAVTFGRSYDAPGYKLDPAAVVNVLISTPAPEGGAKLRLRRLAPFGGATAPAPSAAPNPPATTAPTVDYVPVWADEFDRPGRPDPTKWNFELGPKRRNNELGHYTDRVENARVRNGNLVLEARRESYQGSNYTSASLTTRETHPFVYGRVEVRARLPRGRGLWPGIWILGWHNEKAWWPEVGEIDLVEHVGHEPGSLFFTIHTLERNHQKKNPVQTVLPVQNVHDDYHLYRLDWTPNEVALFYDDREVLRQEKKASDTMAAWPFSNPMYLILNVAVGGDWGGMKGIDDAVFPQRMLIDYVRISKAVPRETSLTGQPSPP